MKFLPSFFVFLLLSIGLQAQTGLTPEEEEEIYEQEVAAKEASMLAGVERFQDQCAVGINVSATVVYFEDYGEVQIDTDQPGEYKIVDERSSYVAGLKISPKQPTYLSLPLNNTYSIIGIDHCDKEFIATTISTKQRKIKDLLTVGRRQYDAMIMWQNQNGEFTFDESILQNSTLNAFEKSFLVQQISFQGEPFKNGRTNHPLKKEDLNNPEFQKMDCYCTEVTIANTYLLSPIERIRNDGRISGIYGSEPATRQSDKVRLLRTWAFEGPSRYTELNGNTKGCAKIDEQWGWNLDQNGEIVQLDIDQGDELSVDPFLEASIEYNLICIDRGSNQSDDCECERDVIFEYDYESVVRAQAEVVRGGAFCGAVREAVAGAVDFMTVTTQEVRDAENTSQMVAGLVNGQTAECNQAYNGPSFSEFVSFAFSVLDLAEDFTDDDARESFIENLDVVFDENWLDTDGCSNDLVGRTRTLPSSNRLTSMTLYQNRPIRITLAAGGSMIVGGQRKWRANARIHSSFRLSGIIVGKKNNEENINCCSPYVGSWLMSTIADDVQGSNERAFGARIRGHFAREGVEQRVWTQTGDFVDYLGLECDYNVNVIVTNPGIIDDGEIIVFRSDGGVNVTVSDLAVPKNLQFTLFDASGRHIGSQSSNSIIATTQIKIGTLPRGVYFSRVTQNGKLVRTLKTLL